MKIRWPALATVSILALCLGPACVSATPTSTSSLMINSFDVNPSSIIVGQSTTLTWTVTGASSVSINQGVGPVGPSGTKIVSPTTTMAYTLTASDGANSTSVTVNISVKTASEASSVQTNPVGSSGPNAPIINSFFANPAIMDAGGVSTLTWDTSGATSVNISPIIGAVDSTGTIPVTPTTSTAYTLTATNASGSATGTVRVMVPSDNSTMLPAVLDFSAQPYVVTENNSAKLSWSVYKANTITINPNIEVPGSTADQESRNLAPSGSATIWPTDNQTYTLTATNWYGTTTASVYVNVWTTIPVAVHGKPIWVDNTTALATSVLPTVTMFTINPATIMQGNSATAYWKTANATRVLLNGQQVPTEGSKIVSASVGGADSMSTVYTLSAYNSFGSYSVSETLTVLGYLTAWFTPLGSN